jgi:hypothetical protein
MKCAITVLVSGLVAIASNASSYEDSPFLPAGYTRTKETSRVTLKQQSAKPFTFQLKGIALLSDTYYFSIFDPKTGRSAWLERDESFNGLTIVGLQDQQLIVRYNNEQRMLPLAHADDRQIPVLASTHRSGSTTIEEPTTPISRRPSAFTARVSRSTQTNPNTSQTASANNSRSSNGYSDPQSANGDRSDTTVPLESPTVETATNGSTGNTANIFNHRFGIDQSRISETL